MNFLSRMIIPSACAMLTAMPVRAQQPDLNDERLRNLELEYVGRDVEKSGAYVYRDLTYFYLFASHTTGWTAGDGCVSTTLPDGNALWCFGDSFFGFISEDRNRTRPNVLARNAGMIQTGEESWHDFIDLNEYITTDPRDRDRYYKAKTWLRHPDGNLTQQEVDNGGSDNNYCYWPGDGTVIMKNGKPVVQYIWGAVDNTMTPYERSIAEYSLEGKPGDPGYMKLIELHRHTPDLGTSHDRIFEDEDGYSYLYGSVGTGGLGAWVHVARVANHDLLSPWEFYVKDEQGNWSWTTKVPTTEEYQRSRISDDFNINISVFKYAGKYFMVNMLMTGSPIYISIADHPWGPFTQQKCLYRIPAEHAAAYITCVHPQLSKTGEIVVSYNMNPADLKRYTPKSDGTAEEHVDNGFWRNFNAPESADLYQSHFVRIFNWQKLYGIPNEGPIKEPNFVAIPELLNH